MRHLIAAIVIQIIKLFYIPEMSNHFFIKSSRGQKVNSCIRHNVIKRWWPNKIVTISTRHKSTQSTQITSHHCIRNFTIIIIYDNSHII